MFGGLKPAGSRHYGLTTLLDESKIADSRVLILDFKRTKVKLTERKTEETLFGDSSLGVTDMLNMRIWKVFFKK